MWMLKSAFGCKLSSVMFAQVVNSNSHTEAFFMVFSVFCQFVTMTMATADHPPDTASANGYKTVICG